MPNALITKKYAIKNPVGTDAAAYSWQTNSRFLAWFAWRVIHGGDGSVVNVNGKQVFPFIFKESFAIQKRRK